MRRRLVETHGLSKQYGAVTALADCTLGIDSGEVFGLLGPNGAGKTTLIRLMLGFLKPTKGSARISGLDCHRQSLEVRKRVSYLPGEVRLFRQMRGQDVLDFFADIRPAGDRARARELADELELDLRRRVAFMSTGMRQKVALAAAFSAEAPVLILDEPTSNLDPTARATVIQLVERTRQQGRTVVFSSHVLSEVEEVCDRVAILREGRLALTQSMSELRRRHRIRINAVDHLPAPPALLADDVTIHRNGDGHITIDTTGQLPPLLGWLATVPLKEVCIEPTGLRPVYEQVHPKRVPKLGE